MAGWNEGAWKNSWWRRVAGKKYMIERNGGGSWERQGNIAFCTRQKNRIELNGASLSKLHQLPHSPQSQQLTSTLLADTTLLRLFSTHTRPYMNSVFGLQAFFWILNPEDETDRLSWKSVIITTDCIISQKSMVVNSYTSYYISLLPLLLL
jgi:hypothetical protein